MLRGGELMAPRGIFITGTDTGVGKTIVAATLARLLRMNGVSVGVMKPVTSGCSEVSGKLISDDARLLCLAAGISVTEDVAPYRLREPLAPAEAARIDGVRIDFAAIKASFDRLASLHQYVIVEGAGGLMVPLSGGLLIADLARELELPLLVVARPGLGTINHTVLTCFAAQQLGLQVAGVIINGMPEHPGRAEQGAPHQIGSLCGAPVLGIWPRSSESDEMAIVDELSGWLDGQAETGIVLRELGVRG
jgi:dethiobiotin synthetase